MRCIYCHSEIEQDALFCPNCGKDLSMVSRCVKCGEILDVGSDYCPYCGTNQSRIQHESASQSSSMKASRQRDWLSWPRVFGMIALLILLGFITYGFIVYSCDGSKNVPHDPDPDYVEYVDSDSIKNVEQEQESQLLQDSLTKVANSLSDSIARITDSLKKANENKEEVERRKNAERPMTNTATPNRNAHRSSSYARTSASSVRAVSTSTGSKNLGYGTFKGSLRNGKPNDVNGRLIFKTSHVIDSRDPKGRIAEAGDYVIGEWSDGHLVQGIWYGSDNNVKGSVIIGK